MNMTKYGKHESDGLWSVKWMRWTMVDEWMGWTLPYEHKKDEVVVR